MAEGRGTFDQSLQNVSADDGRVTGIRRGREGRRPHCRPIAGQPSVAMVVLQGGAAANSGSTMLLLNNCMAQRDCPFAAPPRYPAGRQCRCADLGFGPALPGVWAQAG